MMDIFTKECRKALSDMIASQADSKEDVQEVRILMIVFIFDVRTQGISYILES